MQIDKKYIATSFGHDTWFKVRLANHKYSFSTLAESPTPAHVQQRRLRAVRRLQNLNPSEVRNIQADELRQGW